MAVFLIVALVAVFYGHRWLDATRATRDLITTPDGRSAVTTRKERR